MEGFTQNHGIKFWLVLGIVVFLAVTLAKSDNADVTKTITVQGTGDAYAIQDTLEVNFTVTKVAKDVKVAQSDMDGTVTKIIDAVKKLGAEDKNIKTISYNVYPHYTQVAMPCPAGSYCPIQSKTDGFEASQTIEIKLKDLAKAGELVSAIGEFNPTNVSGLQFTVEDDQAVLRDARKAAIDDAKDKAKQLAKDLGVHLGKVVSFDENGGRVGPMPMYMKADAAVGMGGSVSSASIPTGQNKVTSNVTIVYEIR